MPVFAVIIPFRDRGTDPLRSQNLCHVVDWWENNYGESPYVVSDGRAGNAQFNRSAAYNRGMRLALENLADYDGFIFTESDVIPDTDDQVDLACEMATYAPGLVVPFTEYRALSPEASEAVRNGVPADGFRPEFIVAEGRSKGCMNVVSKRTIDMIGQYDQRFEGNWYDDNAMTIAFELCTGNEARTVDGAVYHLWHLPGHRGEHLTPEDKAATARNKARLNLYKLAAKTNNVARIRQLTAGGM